MLGSFGGTHEQDENDGDAADSTQPPAATAAAAAAAVAITQLSVPLPTRSQADPALLHCHPADGEPTSIAAAVAPAHQLRSILIHCAQLVARSDYHSAAPLVSILSASSSLAGDSTDRLVSQFSKALSLRIHRHLQHSGQLYNAVPLPPVEMCRSTDDLQTVQSSFLALNQVTPFIRFSHLTANQAILEAVDSNEIVHIIDMDTMQGVQWPPLMQAMAERYQASGGKLPPPSIRITGMGSNLETLLKTGSRLERFALSLGLRFRFHPFVVRHVSDLFNLRSALDVSPDEALVVNCVLHLHKLLRKGGSAEELKLILRAIKSMNPRVLTLAEREACHNHPLFFHRFSEALDHYSALFDSLEATLPPGSRERLAVEQVWLRKEILDIVATGDSERRERHERFERWTEFLRVCGFSNVPLSTFAFSQARALLRLHYPSEGYQLQVFNDSFFLGWQNRPLFTVSAWQ